MRFTSSLLWGGCAMATRPPRHLRHTMCRGLVRLYASLGRLTLHQKGGASSKWRALGSGGSWLWALFFCAICGEVAHLGHRARVMPLRLRFIALKRGRASADP